MKIRLSNLLMLVVCIVLSLGWYRDRTDLKKENHDLKLECAELFDSLVETVQVDAWQSLQSNAKFLYDSADPEDRARYKRREGPKKRIP